NNHEGEWEMIEILIDYDTFQQNGLNTIPEGAAYSRHTGGEYREWNDVEVRDTTHPVVYVAEGSHAAYFDKGLFGAQPAGAVDVVGGSDEPEEPTSVAIIENDPWLEFGGNWGYRSAPGYTGPQGPKYHETKWYHPVEWAFDHQDNPPDPLPWQQYPGMISLSCPADMFIANSQGQITGTKNGEFIQEIPDSYVNSLGEQERYLILMNDRYTVEINGTGTGEFDFSAAFTLWNKSNIWGYTDIPVTPSTTAYTEMSPTMTEYIIEIDHDGDSIIDETITPNMGVSLSSPNVIQPLQLNTTLNYEIEITNEGDQQETFTLDYDLPNDWTGSLSQETITVGPKETKTITLSVNVPDTEIKDYELRITASSEGGLNTFLTLLSAAKPELCLSSLNMEYNENEVILSCDASNLGLLDVDNVKVQFYNGKPDNNLIGEKIISLASEETKNVSVPWTAEDGIYNIYAVIDPDNTITESAEYNNTTFKQFTIDRTPPEANIKFNTETQDIEVIGIDDFDKDVEVSYEECTEKLADEDDDEDEDNTFEDEIEIEDDLFEEMEIDDLDELFEERGFRTYRVYTLKDDAGNMLKMKMLYLKHRRAIYTRIVELSYNEELTTPQRNAFGIVSIYRRGELKRLVQHLRIQRDMVNVNYNAKKDRSIITREGVEKRDGLVLIVMRTEEGKLSYRLE
ncbi:MAG: CARDB domain-containing protein, partial [Euryarchaeota archaeon]|nr:CARDB domain-containing protein [Euryarchaeota archaeon]